MAARLHQPQLQPWEKAGGAQSPPSKAGHRGLWTCAGTGKGPDSVSLSLEKTERTWKVSEAERHKSHLKGTTDDPSPEAHGVGEWVIKATGTLALVIFPLVSPLGFGHRLRWTKWTAQFLQPGA